jgi:phospholipid:diacylglycerol acyltransferase
MSFLRRRFVGDDVSSEPSREPSPSPDAPADLRVIGARTLSGLKKRPKQKKRTNFWIFALGGLFGLAVAAFFVGSNDMIDLSSLEGMNLNSIMDVLPAGFLRDAQQLQVGSPFLATHETRHSLKLHPSADRVDSVET